MEVHFTVPEDLVRRIEYIPEQVLPEVLTSVFRAGIEKMTRPMPESHAQGADVAQLLALVLDTVKSVQPDVTATVSARPPAEKELVRQRVDAPVRQAVERRSEPVLQVDDDDDELGELLGLMK